MCARSCTQKTEEKKNEESIDPYKDTQTKSIDVLPCTASGGHIKSLSPAIARTGTLLLCRWSL